jgi:Fe2+ transport system protein FeoA
MIWINSTGTRLRQHILDHTPNRSNNENASQLYYSSEGNTLNILIYLSELAAGQRAFITGIHAPETTRQRLQSMGLRTGREAEVIRSPRLGPMQIRIGSVHLIMRRSDAARVCISSHQ